MIRTIKNDPSKCGQLARKKKVFGKNNRYAVAPVYSRFETIAWFVWDAEKIELFSDYDPVMGYEPAVIRIEETYSKAIYGLQ